MLENSLYNAQQLFKKEESVKKIAKKPLEIDTNFEEKSQERP